jgi:hypothetical protein
MRDDDNRVTGSGVTQGSHSPSDARRYLRILYSDTFNLRTRVHLRDDGLRPFIELEPTDHPLAIEQREGISIERVADLYTQMIHHDSQ